jgi:hypothetical protein
MRNPALFAFGVTIACLSPMFAASLDAGPKQEEMLFAADARSFVVNGVTVKVSIDHGIADRGATVTLHLEAERAVAVGLVMLGSTGTEGARVPDPPLGLLHRNVTVDQVAGDHVVKDIPIKLVGAVQEQAFATYSIYAMSPAAARRLDRLQRHATPPVQPGEGPPEATASSMKLWHALGAIRRDGEVDSGDEKPDDEARQFAKGTTARLEVVTRPRDQALAIAMPDEVRSNVAFDVQVTLTNSSRKAAEVYARLDVAEAPAENHALGGNDVVVAPDGMQVTLAPHERRDVTFHVTASKSGMLGLIAVGDGLAGHAFGATAVTDAVAAR